jgi:hypothetical protein
MEKQRDERGKAKELNSKTQLKLPRNNERKQEKKQKNVPPTSPKRRQ